MKKQHAWPFSYRELSEITHGFSKRNYIGRFQFGKIYRGMYWRKAVTVKIWDQFDSLGNKINPIINLRRIRDEAELLMHFEEKEEPHQNIVLCKENFSQRQVFALVYRLNAVATLHNLITKDDFTWYLRIKSALGIASALTFMHTHNPPILLRNLDAAHILLDQEYTPMLYEFSMVSSAVCTDWTNLIHDNEKGSHGYTDPSLFCNNLNGGSWSDKSDVFAFGVVLLCLISKRIYTEEDKLRSAPFVYEWAKSEFRLKKAEKCPVKALPSLVHESLQWEKQFFEEDGYRLTKLALQCVEYDPDERPDMKSIFWALLSLHIVRCDGNTLGIRKVLPAGDCWKDSLSVSGAGAIAKRMNPALIQAARKKEMGCCTFSYKDLCYITDDFSEENLIENSHFGKLYRGKIGKKSVTVKTWDERWNSYTCTYKEGNKSRLLDELALFQHPRFILHSCLPSPIGFCYETEGQGLAEVEYLAIVYDLNPLDTVDKIAPKGHFSWLQRVKVALRFASLLAFLHTSDGCNLPLYIRNLSTTHVLIDQDYNPYLYDFGMCSGGVLRDRRYEEDPCLHGYPGFIDLYSTYDKLDVYAYGLILLSLIMKAGYEFFYPENSLYSEALKAYKEKVRSRKDKAMFSLVHQSLQDDPNFNFSDGPKITKLALQCAAYDSYDRPTMSQVVRRLHKLSSVSNNKRFFGID